MPNRSQEEPPSFLSGPFRLTNSGVLDPFQMTVKGFSRLSRIKDSIPADFSTAISRPTSNGSFGQWSRSGTFLPSRIFLSWSPAGLASSAISPPSPTMSESRRPRSKTGSPSSKPPTSCSNCLPGSKMSGSVWSTLDTLFHGQGARLLPAGARIGGPGQKEPPSGDASLKTGSWERS